MWTQTLSGDALDLVEYIDKNISGMSIQINTFDKIYFSRENSAMASFCEITGMPNIIRHYRDVDEPMAKIVFGDNNEKNIVLLSELLAAHPLADSFDFIHSEPTFYEILPKGVSKGSILPKIAEYMNISMDKTIAIGDYNNDIEMIRKAKLGVAVENACDDLKRVADHVTVSNEQGAIARLISDIENGYLTV